MNVACRIGNQNILEFVRESGAALMEFVPVSSAAIITLDDELRPFACHSLKRTPLFQTHGYMNSCWKFDPLLPKEESSESNRIRSWFYQKSTDAAPKATDIYNSFLRNEACIEALRIDIKHKNRTVGCVALGREAAQGAFTPKEIELLHKCLKLLDLSEKITTPEASHLIANRLEPYHFTNREVDIIQLLKAGESNKEIANHLGIGLPTIKSHLINIFKKAGVNSRTGLLATIYL